MNQTKTLTLKVFTPNGLLYEFTELSTINVPLANGYPLGVLPGHAPLIAGTAQGKVRFSGNNKNGALSFHAGILSIRDNVIIIFTAGELGETNQSQAKEEDIKYNRLMETLVNTLQKQKGQSIN